MKRISFIVIFIIYSFLAGCSPITPLTSVKKTPKIYTQNFCCDQEVKRYLGKKVPWIVYSQSDNNPTYYNPGGKIVLKKTSYMEAFLVIGKKGEYLRLIKHKPEIIENSTLKNRKQIEYYGWIHQDNLLLSSKALTDIESGRTHKMITMMKSEKPLSKTENFLSKDSLVLYKEPELLNPIKKIALHSLVYLYKKNDDRSKSLIFVKPQINPENAQQVISGWVSSSFITPYGTSFYSKISEMPLEKITLIDKLKKEISQDTIVFDANGSFLELNPISSLKQEQKFINIDTYVPIPVVDNGANYVYGLSGNVINYEDFKKVKKDLKHINIVFAFESQQSVISNFEQLVVSINQLKNQLPSKDNFVYRIGAVIGFGRRYNTLLQVPLSKNIDVAVKELEKLADSKKEMDFFKTESWGATLQASQILSEYKNENNIIVVIGESGNDKEQIDNHLVQRIVSSNARILGYQLYSDTGNLYNNFILQIQDIISRSSQEIIKKKKNFLVNSTQLCTENLFVEHSENIYRLDFSEQSMWQGWIVFPKKKEQMSQDLLVSSISSFIEEIQVDAQNITDQLQKSFIASGMSRSKINPQWVSLQNLSEKYSPDITFAKALAGTEPYTFFPALIQVKKDVWDKGEHFLLLSEDEIDNIRSFFTDITKKRVDYKYDAKKSEKLQKNSFLDDDGVSVKDETKQSQKYLNTRKVRKSLQKSYYKWSKVNRLYPPKKQKIKKATLAEAGRYAVLFYSPKLILKQLKVGEIRNRKKISDKDLDELIEYFVRKKDAFEQGITTENQLKSNGEVLYKINVENLP
ncbi:type VI secretion system protein TssR domain-containing protein [Capnocytophaga cynodegmi]|uniref:type VI secretion system protein TssR domain-containing protein n=1 Tax=Capnocytophaga cynodegmi TaxID=28189 RepID=UPI003858944C